MGLYDFNIYDVIIRNALCFKDKDAWFEVEDNSSLTFAQLKEKVDHLAEGMQNLGVEKRDRIAVVGQNCVEYFLLYGAAAALGAIISPINWRLSEEELTYNLNDCSPKAVFVGKEYQDLINGVREKLSSEVQCFSLDRGRGMFTDFHCLLDNEGNFEQVEVFTDDGFVIIYTAAVGGTPRGALLGHGNVLCTNIHSKYSLNLTEEDVYLNLVPFFHVGGLFMTMATFHAGALTVNMRKFDVVKAVKLIQEKRASVMLDFAPMLSSILEQQEISGIDIKSLRAVAGLDTPETIEKYQKLTGGNFYCCYGQTEVSAFATLSRYNERPGSAGKILPLVEMKLVDANDRPVQIGQIGEITIKGPLVFKGYWNLPEENAFVFRNGRHHTGDLGRFDEDGFLWYEGRKADKDLIKPGGENVYPAEVEKAILEHPAVKITVVFGVPDPKWKEGIKAVCQLKEGHALSPQELIDFVGERIARYKKPQFVEFVTDFPITEGGSPDRAKIMQLFGVK